jgi:large subunit ribosomal protein L17
MPHQIARKRLNRTQGPRRALLRSLATAFFKHEKIETTTSKAKEISKVVERLITQARRGDLHSRICSSLQSRKNSSTKSGPP